MLYTSGCHTLDASSGDLLKLQSIRGRGLNSQSDLSSTFLTSKHFVMYSIGLYKPTMASIMRRAYSISCQ
jgi:hypothetical protein